MSDTVQRPLPVWAIYVFMVICFVFTSYVPNVSLLWGVVIIAGYLVRAMVRKAGAELEASHASWQIRTLWLWLWLICLLLIAVLIVFGVVGTDDVLVQVNALTDQVQNGTMSPIDMLAELWKIPSLKITVCVVIVFCMLFAVWPLKRTLQGVLAMSAGLTPHQLPTSRCWLALGVAILIQVLLPFIVFGMSGN